MNEVLGREVAVDEVAAKVASDRHPHILSGVREIGFRGFIDVPRWAAATSAVPVNRRSSLATFCAEGRFRAISRSPIALQSPDYEAAIAASTPRYLGNNRRDIDLYIAGLRNLSA